MSYLAIRTTDTGTNDNNPLVDITFTCYLYKTWAECGIAQVHRFLEALGFSTPEEVQSFCSSLNVIDAFGERNFVENLISDADRQILPQALRQAQIDKLAPPLFTFTSKFEVIKKTNPDYNDFFQFLFTWLTTAHEVGREGFIKWWEEYNAPPKPPLRNPSQIVTFTVKIRKSFKDKVDDFLGRLRNPSKPSSDATPFMRLTHAIKTFILSYAFREANWDYVSGTAASVSGNLPGDLASAGAGGGQFFVYDKDNPEILQNLKFYTVSLGAGLGFSSPVSVAVDPAAFPTAGKIYHGLFEDITGFHSFQGNYISVTLGASSGVNLTSNVIFITDNLSTEIKFMQPGSELVELLVDAIKDSKAVIAVDGHGTETSIGISGQFSIGFTQRGSRIKKANMPKVY